MLSFHSSLTKTQLNVSNISISFLAPHPLGNIKVANINYASINISWVAPGIETGPTNYIASALDKFAPYLNGSCETQGYQYIKEFYSNQLIKLHL